MLESSATKDISNMAIKRRQWRPVDGVLLLDKPKGVSSNAALQRARRLLNAERAGHSGTLDPMATGLLVLSFGEATKFSSEAFDAEKRYVAHLLLGERTSTGDAEGEVLEKRPVLVSRERIEAVLAQFRGQIAQIPPMHSALKRDGRPLYEYARRGISVDRAPRTVTISALALDALSDDKATLSISCSKGTYVRTLAEDIGEALGCGAHLVGLCRTSVGPFSLGQAHRLDVIEGLDGARHAELLLPIDILVQHLPTIRLPDHMQRGFLHGQPVLPFQGSSEGEVLSGKVRVYGMGGRFLGLALADAEGRVHPKRVLAGVQ